MTNLDSFQKVALYIVQHSPGLGKTKLNKGLFIADALYYAHYEKSYTGCEYIKEKQGPIPNNECYSKIKNLLNRDILVQQYEDIPNQDYAKHAYYINNSLPNNQIENYFSDFDNDFIDILKATIRFISNKSAKQLSDFTHNDVYENAVMRKVIPLEDMVKFVVNDEYDTKEPENIKELLGLSNEN